MMIMTRLRKCAPGRNDCDSQSPASGRLCQEDSCLNKSPLKSLFSSDLQGYHKV